MNLAIIICAHGLLAQYILKAAEMIVGKQKNIDFINFLNNENTDILSDKYNESLSILNKEHGVLFLVDIWGGTPFNAANKIILFNENYKIITGINIPMLIELFIARDDYYSIDEIVDISIKYGISGIKLANKIK